MGKTENIIDVCMLTIGSTYSLANIEETLGIIILIIQLVWILTKIIARIIKAIREHDPFNVIEEDIDEEVYKLKPMYTDSNKQEDNDENGKTDRP